MRLQKVSWLNVFLGMTSIQFVLHGGLDGEK